MNNKFSKTNYNKFPAKVNKDDAVALLKVLRKDITFMDQARRRAVVWAKDNVDLTFQEIADALGYRAQSYIHKLYYETKGGGKES